MQSLSKNLFMICVKIKISHYAHHKSSKIYIKKVIKKWGNVYKKRWEKLKNKIGTQNIFAFAFFFFLIVDVFYGQTSLQTTLQTC